MFKNGFYLGIKGTFNTTDIRTHLEWVVKHDVLSGQFQQHRVVEELIDGDVFTKSLSSAGLDHELSRQMSGRLRLQGADHNALVQRVTRNNLNN